MRTLCKEAACNGAFLKSTYLDFSPHLRILVLEPCLNVHKVLEAPPDGDYGALHGRADDATRPPAACPATTRILGCNPRRRWLKEKPRRRWGCSDDKLRATGRPRVHHHVMQAAGRL